MDSGQKLTYSWGYTVLRLLCECVCLQCLCVCLGCVLCDCVFLCATVTTDSSWILNVATSSICDHCLDCPHAIACDLCPCCYCVCVLTTRRNDACRDCDTYPWTISMGYKKETEEKYINIIWHREFRIRTRMQSFLFPSKLAIILRKEFWLEFRNIYEVFRDGQHIDY